MIDIKKFTAFICFNEELRNLYYDIIESRSIISSWDVYNVQEDKEKPSELEISIMQEIFDTKIKNNIDLMVVYDSAVVKFKENIKNKILFQLFSNSLN